VIAVPFLTNRFLTDPEQVERLYRPLSRIPSSPPVRPSKPVSADVEAAQPPLAADVVRTTNQPEPDHNIVIRKKRRRRLSVTLRVRLKW
jgi:hypothetical protein